MLLCADPPPFCAVCLSCAMYSEWFVALRIAGLS